MNEVDPVSNKVYFEDTAPECCGIPTGMDALAVFAMFYEAGAVSQDAATIDPVLNNGCKGQVFSRLITLCDCLLVLTLVSVQRSLSYRPAIWHHLR